MRSMWKNIPCDYISKKLGERASVHSYDFGAMEFDLAEDLFSRFSDDADYAIGEIEEGFRDDVYFIGGQQEHQLNFYAIREGDKVRVTLKIYESV